MSDLFTIILLKLMYVLHDILLLFSLYFYLSNSQECSIYEVYILLNITCPIEVGKFHILSYFSMIKFVLYIVYQILLSNLGMYS